MTERRPLDAYFTTDADATLCVNAFAREFTVQLGLTAPNVVVEPSVGDGAFVRAARVQWPAAHIVGCDINPDATGLALCDQYHVGDWVQWGVPQAANDMSVCIGNPPFSDAEAHVVHALTRPGIIATGFLLRLTFLESQTRESFWNAFPPTCVRVFRKRPSFMGGATDSTAYAFFMWFPRVSDDPWRGGWL